MSTARRRKNRAGRKGFRALMMDRQERSLLGLLRDEPAFRWAVGGILFLFALLVLLVPRILITTPRGFTPVIRVSGLDLLQAAALRRSARAGEQAGNFNAASQAWISAVANNPGDPALLQGFLGLLATQAAPDPKWLGQVLARGSFLLQLSQTNQSDLELVARVFHRYELDDWVVARLQARIESLTPAGAATLAEALFSAARMRELGELYDRHPATPGVDDSARLCHAAWRAGWGPAPGVRAALDELQAAIGIESTRVAARRRRLVVHSARWDLASYEKDLEGLEADGADLLRDHVRHWLLLSTNGQRARALALVREHTRPPRNATEAELLLRAYLDLGVPDLALAFMKTQLANFPADPQVWFLLAQNVMEARQWDELRLLASQMRNRPAIAASFGSYPDLLEGLSEFHADHAERARASFDKVVRTPPPTPLLSLEAATGLQRLGFASHAAELFTSVEGQYTNRVDLWLQTAKAAHDARQAALVLRACRRAYDLAPNDPLLANNYAAALLLQRTNAAEAIRITFDLAGRAGTRPAFRINHAVALVQNRRPAEALAVLQSVSAAALPPAERSLWHLCRFEAELAVGQPDQAREAAARVELRYLFPNQLDWLKARLRELDAPPAA
ncbi:MAG: hypothetical protein ACKOET_18080 [Verrucomicrobiota bacterium]